MSWYGYLYDSVSGILRRVAGESVGYYYSELWGLVVLQSLAFVEISADLILHYFFAFSFSFHSILRVSDAHIPQEMHCTGMTVITSGRKVEASGSIGSKVPSTAAHQIPVILIE